MSGDAPTTGEETQITCKFVTRLPEEYRISPTPFAVPGKLTRYGLSEVINHLLALDPPKPFDFLVDGELVRTSLEKLLLRKGISAESTLDVEYIPAVGPPSDEATGAHEDWVSAVDGGWAPAVATGCYDGTARLYLPSGKLACKVTAGDGSAPVTTVSLLPPDEGASGCVLVAGGHDGVVRSWTVSDKLKPSSAPRLFVGHAGAVSAVAAAPGGEFFASAGHDRTVRVWRREGGVEDTPTAGGDEKPSRLSSKRRKAADGEATRGGGKPSCLEPPPEPTERMTPLGAELVLEGHGDVVSCVSWESATMAWTGGFDHALKCWDADEGRLAQSFDAPRAVASVAARAGGGRVAWCGGGDRAVHAWDPRVGQTTGATTTWNSHTVRKKTGRPSRVDETRVSFIFSASRSRLSVERLPLALVRAVDDVGDERRTVSRRLSGLWGEQISNFFPRRRPKRERRREDGSVFSLGFSSPLAAPTLVDSNPRPLTHAHTRPLTHAHPRPLTHTPSSRLAGDGGVRPVEPRG